MKTFLLTHLSSSSTFCSIWFKGSIFVKTFIRCAKNIGLIIARFNRCLLNRKFPRVNFRLNELSALAGFDYNTKKRLCSFSIVFLFSQRKCCWCLCARGAVVVVKSLRTYFFPDMFHIDCKKYWILTVKVESHDPSHIEISFSSVS